MKLATHIYLDEHNIPYQIRTFPADTEKGAANVAHALGYQARQMVKTLIMQTGEGEMAMVLIGGDQKAISGHLKKAIGSRNIRMASFEAIEEVTGYKVGSIPPFGWQPEEFRSFIEASLLTEEVLGVGAGVWGNEIMITPADLVRASRATVVNLTDREQPVISGFFGN